MVSPATRSTLVCSAQQGSRPAPTRLDRGVCRVSAAGRSSVPCRPRNSRRSAVHCVCRPARSANATREPNSALHGLRANMAPVSGSMAVTMNGAQAGREDPSTHSTYAVTESLRGRGEVLRSEEHTSELQSHSDLVCRLLLEKKKKKHYYISDRTDDSE